MLPKMLTLNCIVTLVFFRETIADGLADFLKNDVRNSFQLFSDLELLLSQTIDRSLDDINCVAIFRDEKHSKVFGPLFFRTLGDVPTYSLEIMQTEDLLAPNFKTLRFIKGVRRSGCRFVIIFLSSGRQVGRFLRFGDRNRELDTRANFVILHDRALLDSGLFYLWKKIVNVVFVRQFASRPGVPSWYELLTVPFPSPITDVLRLRRLDIWRLGVFKQNTLLFRDKTSDLQGQRLRAVTFQHVPAAFKAPAPTTQANIIVEGTEPVGFAGVEIEVISTLSRIMNFNQYVYDVPDGELWGHEIANGSYTGLIGEIAEGHADFALGDLHHTPHNLRYMDLTIPYNTQCLTFLTPEALTDNSWQTLILPFKGSLWAGVLISLVAGSISFYTLAKFQEHMNLSTDTHMEIHQSRGVPLLIHNNLTEKQPLEGIYQFSQPDNSVLYTYSMLLLVSLPKLPSGWSLRVLTGCWWIYSILVVVAYRASMTAILANPAPRVTIDTLEELAESKIAVGGWSDQVMKFFQTSLDTAGKKIASKFEMEMNVDRAVERVARGEFAFYENTYFLQHASVRRRILTMEAAHGSASAVTSNSDRNLHIMSNCVIYMPISLGLQKNSPFKPRVDRYLRQITQAGLVEKWVRDAMSTVLSVDRTDSAQSQKALMSLKKFLGALVALAAGYGISTIALVVEIVYWHCTVRRNPSYDKYSNAVVITTKKIDNKTRNTEV